MNTTELYKFLIEAGVPERYAGKASLLQPEKVVEDKLNRVMTTIDVPEEGDQVVYMTGTDRPEKELAAAYLLATWLNITDKKGKWLTPVDLRISYGSELPTGAGINVFTNINLLLEPQLVLLRQLLTDWVPRGRGVILLAPTEASIISALGEGVFGYLSGIATGVEI